MMLTIESGEYPHPPRKAADSLSGCADESCRLAAILAADCFDIPLDAILADTRGTPKSTYARQAAMYLSHVALGVTFTAIGRFFGRDHSTVAHACRQVEDRRDNPAFDALIGELALAARMALHLDPEIAA